MLLSLAALIRQHMKKVIILACIMVMGFYLYRGAKKSLMHADWSARYSQQFLDKQRKYLHGARFEYVTFLASSGDEHDRMHKFERKGILYINPQAKANIVICHGYMCNKFDIGFIRHALFSRYNVLVFDFRAHGEKVDARQLCTFGKDEAFDVQAAARYIKLRSDIGRLPCIGYGFSMGAVATILAQAMDNNLFHALILDCSYDTAEKVLKRSIEKLYISIFGYDFDIPGRSLLERFAFNPYVQSMLKVLLKTVAHMDATATNTCIKPANPVDAIKTVSIPCFFIHCRNDDKVPAEASKNLFAHAGGYKRLWITNGRHHFDSIFYNPEKYVYKVNAFIQSFLDGSMKQKKPSKVLYDEPIGTAIRYQ